MRRRDCTARSPLGTWCLLSSASGSALGLAAGSEGLPRVAVHRAWHGRMAVMVRDVGMTVDAQFVRERWFHRYKPEAPASEST